jgi:hypothetical protein
MIECLCISILINLILAYRLWRAFEDAEINAANLFVERDKSIKDRHALIRKIEELEGKHLRNQREA